MDAIQALRQRIQRERTARKEAEGILELKALELWKANQELRALNESLESRVADQAQELIDNELKYKRIMENMELGLLEVDTFGRIVKAYDWFCDMVGFSPEELVGQLATEIFLPDSFLPILEEQDRNRLRGQSGVYEVQMKKKGGEMIWVLISGTPIFNKSGKVTGSMGIHYDITKRKELQLELEQAKQVAEAAQEAEKQFLANMSHEIRTPLNAVIGMTHLLFDTRLSPKQKEYLSILKSSAAILRGLISDILDFSKIESGQMEVQTKEFDLVGLLKAVQKTFQLKLEGKPVEMELEVDVQIQNMVLGDDLMLNQILYNLIGNAEKFTAEGQITLGVKLMERIGNHLKLEFQVRDTGIGIEPEKKDLIFKDFKQASNEIKLKYGGTGLGLGITKRLIEMQGGSIMMESALGAGTTFKFYLEYEDTKRRSFLNSQELSQTMPVDVETLRVLVVEDNYMNRKYISTLLQKWNINFEMVTDGQQAIDIAQKEKFDLILMDLQMPIVDGFEATIGIRSTNNLNQNVPIIALTASAMVKEKDRAEQVGMTDFLSKPFTPVQLLGLLNNYGRASGDTRGAALDVYDRTEDVFQFSPALDQAYLQAFYDDDLEHAADIFETFLGYSLVEFEQLPGLLKNESREAFRKQVHKLKPAFSMVGLTKLMKKMERLEKLCYTDEPDEVLADLLQQVSDSVQQKNPILEQELERMKNRLESA